MVIKRFLWFTILLLLVGLLNYFGRKKLPYGYADLLSYNQLYATGDQLHITSIEKSGQDSLSIQFSGAAIKVQNRFEVYAAGAKLLDQTAPSLTMRPLSAYHEYLLTINATDTVKINVEFYPGSSGGKPSMVDITTPLLIEANPLHNPGDWSPNPPLSGTDDRAGEIRHYLQDSMRINGDDPSEEKVRKISSYILAVTTGKYGNPSDSMAGLAPIEQLNCVRLGLSRLFCGNYGNIFAFFSNKAGVPTRYIESGTLTGGILNGSHVVNEVYLKEYSKWAFVDLTDSIVFVKKNGRFLNTVDIQRLLRYAASNSSDSRADPDMVALQYHKDILSGKDSLARIPFGRASFFAKNAFNPSNKFTFYYGNYSKLTSSRNPMDKIRNFLYPGAYYALYSDNIGLANAQFYGRLASTYIFAVLTLIWIGLLLYRLASALSRRRLTTAKTTAKDSH